MMSATSLENDRIITGDSNHDASPPVRHRNELPQDDAQHGVKSKGKASDVRNGLFALLDQGIVSGTSFGTAVILGRTLSPKEFGVFYLAMTLIWVARGIQEQIIASPYMILCHRKKGDRLASYMGSTQVHQLALSALCVLGLLVFGLGSMSWFPSSFTPVIWVLLGTVPFVLLREHLRVVAISHLRIRSAFVFDASIVPLQIGGLLLLAHLDLLTVTTAIGVVGVTCAIGCLGWFLICPSALNFERRQIASDWKKNWVLGRWALLGYFISGTLPYALPWILLATHGEAAAGVLAACMTVIGLPKMFVNGLANYFSPRSASAFCHGGVQALRRFLWKSGFVFMAGVGTFCILILAIGGSLMTFIYDGAYGGTGTILSVLAFFILAKSLGNIMGYGLWAIERPQSSFVGDACTTVATLALVACLIHPMGVLGVAVAMLFGAVTGTILKSLAFAKRLGDLQHQPQPT